MRIFSSTCEIGRIFLLIFFGLLFSSVLGVGVDEVNAGEPRSNTDAFDPLELAGDTINVPLQMTRITHAAQQGRLDSSRHISSQETSLSAGLRRDTGSYQSFRVQLTTSETYGDMRRALQVAEEVFDQPVFLDYDVPYFKLRVGDFKTRSEADLYALKAKAAGYPNAWVVVVTVAAHQASPTYDLSVGKSPDSAGTGTPLDSL